MKCRGHGPGMQEAFDGSTNWGRLERMARIRFDIVDPAQRLTLKAILERDGHEMVADAGELCIADTFGGAVAAALDGPSLMLASPQHLEDAVLAMEQGVYGYIILPFIPGEASLMVRRALDHHIPRPKPESAFEPETLEAVEQRHIEGVLRHCRYNQAKAARLLGIGRNTLWRKRKRTEGVKGEEQQE